MRLTSLTFLFFFTWLVASPSHGLNLNSMTAASSLIASNKAQNLIITSPQQAISVVKRKYKAKVLRVQSTNQGSPGYKVKLVTKDGQVFTVFVNAVTGAVSRN